MQTRYASRVCLGASDTATLCLQRAYVILWCKAPVFLVKMIALVQMSDDLRLCDLGLSHHIGQDFAQTSILQEAAAVSSIKCFQADKHNSASFWSVAFMRAGMYSKAHVAAAA